MPTPIPGALETMRALARSRPLRTWEPGEVIFRSGEPGDCLFGVVEGSVRISWDDDGSTETIGPGCTFGIGALVDPSHRRHGTATAEAETQLLVMNREEFLFALQELPVFGLEMLHGLDERLREIKSRTISRGSGS